MKENGRGPGSEGELGLPIAQDEARRVERREVDAVGEDASCGGDTWDAGSPELSCVSLCTPVVMEYRRVN